MDLYLVARLLHIFGSTVLFGTGIGIAFFMFRAHFTRDPKIIAATAETVVTADFVFTATAVVLQPLTGYWLMRLTGLDFSEGWIILALALYVLTGLCWLPVVAIQMRLRDLARAADHAGQPLDNRYDRMFWLWFALGWPAFSSVIGIFWLMVAKPDITWL